MTSEVLVDAGSDSPIDFERRKHCKLREVGRNGRYCKMPVTLCRTSMVSESARGEQQIRSPDCAAIELLWHCVA